MNARDSVKWIHRGILLSGLLVVLLPAVALAQDVAQDAAQKKFLRTVIQLTDDQLAAVEKGEVVTKILPSADKPEIAAFGVVKVPGTVDQLLAAARDIQKFRRSPQIPQMGLFSNPAKLSDLAGLDFPPDDIAALKKCKAGSCDVKLGTKGLEDVAAIDWKAADAPAKATATLKQSAVDLLVAYQQAGTDAMANVADKKDEKSRAQEYRAVLTHSPYLADWVKEFDDYLLAYPKGTLAGAEDVFYWTKDTFGPKPIVSAYHVTFYKGPRGALIASKLLAASHFFNAALDLMAGTPAPDGKSIYLMSLVRTRLDPPTGMLAGALMGKVRSGVEDSVKANLTSARDRLAAAQ